MFECVHGLQDVFNVRSRMNLIIFIWQKIEPQIGIQLFKWVFDYILLSNYWLAQMVSGF